jgi:hypothetical protein
MGTNGTVACMPHTAMDIVNETSDTHYCDLLFLLLLQSSTRGYSLTFSLKHVCPLSNPAVSDPDLARVLVVESR